MRTIVRSIVLTALLICSGTAALRAEEFEPLQRNLIFVEGNADIIVPVNCFELRFGFDVSRKSFSESSNESAQIIATVQEKVSKLGLSDVEVIKGWDYIKQAKISLGDSGRKLSNVLTVRVKNFPPGKLHELISRIIDDTLEVNKDIALEEVKAYLSDDAENLKRGEVVAAALKALQANAEKTGTAVGKKTVTPKRVYTMADRMVEEDQRQYEGRLYFSKSAMVSVQKSFNVTAQVVDRVKLSAHVSGIYQVD